METHPILSRDPQVRHSVHLTKHSGALPYEYPRVDIFGWRNYNDLLHVRH